MKSQITKYRNDDGDRDFFGREAPAKLLRLGVALFSLLAASLASPQSISAAPSDAIAILQQVGQRYTDAKSYHIQAIKELTDTNDFQHNWHKTILNAAEAPGSRYHFEALTGSGLALDVSDGTTEWVYSAAVHAYTQKPARSDSPTMPRGITILDSGPIEAQDLRKSLADLSQHYKSATQLPDETITLEGTRIPCMVIRMLSSDLKHPSTDETSSEETIWIDRSRMVVVKRLKRSSKYWNMGGVQIPIKEDDLTTYPTMDLDLQEADSLLFSFSPPQNARLVEALPDPFTPDQTGKAAPPLTLKSADGKQVTLASFRGKPVLIDLWASWCAPCVDSLPRLAHLYRQTRDTNLVIIAIDRDEEAKDATDFLARKNYTWPDFHDEGEVRKAFGASGIPRSILIDAKGVIVYDAVGVREDDLITAVLKLGPEYAFLASKEQQDPCVASQESPR